MSEFIMPSLGADMKKGTLAEWRVTPGDHVKRGDIIAAIETDKGVIEIEVFEDGIIEEILVQAGEVAPVGSVLAIIRVEGKPKEVNEKTKPEVETEVERVEQVSGKPEFEKAEHVAEKTLAIPPEKRIKISPFARKRAAELGIDPGSVKGTGSGGAITKTDIERAAHEQTIIEREEITPPPGEEKPSVVEKPFTVDSQAGMRKAIAAAMSRSNREIPHYYLETRIDVSRTLQWLEAENKKRSVKERVLPAVLLIKAVALALVDVPELNGYWIDDHHQSQEAIHIGFAISLRQGGLVTPAIHHADLKNSDELMEALRDLITRTRSGRLRGSQMTDATITITNLGDLGVEKVYGVIYPPQVALIGFGKIMDQPWTENGMIGIRQVVTATLAADHRATDGHRGAQFLVALNRHLQEPEKL